MKEFENIKKYGKDFIDYGITPITRRLKVLGLEKGIKKGDELTLDLKKENDKHFIVKGKVMLIYKSWVILSDYVTIPKQ